MYKKYIKILAIGCIIFVLWMFTPFEFSDKSTEVMGSNTIDSCGSHYANYVVINEIYYGNDYKIWNHPDGSWWIEIYNPTNRVFYLTALTFLDIDCITVLPPENSIIEFKPHEFILFCGSVENLTAAWDIPNGTKIIELSYYGHNASMTITSDDEKSEVGSGKYHDYIGTGGEYYPLPPFNHSWARYMGGYDTDNFTNDFYDEPYPTPGYANHLIKGEDGYDDIDGDGKINYFDYDDDGDGYNDSFELLSGTDPCNCSSFPGSTNGEFDGQEELKNEPLSGNSMPWMTISVGTIAIIATAVFIWKMRKNRIG